jgi:alkylation response protein AidB-like acyl-CoA dehydrogenase
VLAAPSETEEILLRARRLADEVLFPRAVETDLAPLVPLDRLDAMAAAGMYGLVGPREAGGLDAPPEVADRAVELLAGGCLTTTFVCMQHHGVVATVAASPAELREQWLAPLCNGEVRSGVAFAGLRRPGPPVMTVRGRLGGFVLEGYAPWVTGWGRIDLVHVAARDEAGDVLWFIVDAADVHGMRVEALQLAAVNASGTVTLHFDGLTVPSERLTRREAFDEWRLRDAGSLRRNGSLALGVAGRAVELLRGYRDLDRLAAGLERQIDDTRSRLDSADVEGIAAARAGASRLAMRATSVLVTAGGGRSILLDQHAQRLAREALFLLVFGQTPAIRTAQLSHDQ